MITTRSNLAAGAVPEEELALWLRLDELGTETDLLAQLSLAATLYAEERTDSTLVARSVTATFYDGDRLTLHAGPANSITSITDADGTSITAYELRRYGHYAELHLNQAAKFPLVVVYNAGYATVPEMLRTAIKMHVAHLYRNRESVSDKQQHDVAQGLESIYALIDRSHRL